MKKPLLLNSAVVAIFLFVATTLSFRAFGQGNLTPPGPPTATMKTLDPHSIKAARQI